MPATPRHGGSIDILGAYRHDRTRSSRVRHRARTETSWGSAETLLTLAAAVVLPAAFVGVQARRRQPLMRLSIFHALYLQQVLDLGAFASGSAPLPMTVTIMIVMITVAPRLLARVRRQADDRDRAGRAAAALFRLSLVRPDGTF
jgi:K+-sensing histidine kinase KdpD